MNQGLRPCSRGRTTIAVLTFSLLAACFITPAAGFSEEEARQACTPDVFRLCSNDIPDRGRIEACLRREARALSPACHRILTGGRGVERPEHRERRRERAEHREHRARH